MTDKKLKELLIVIDNRYGRVRSKEDRIQITDVIKWIAVCVAISISVYVTRDGRYLWFLLIPAFLI